MLDFETLYQLILYGREGGGVGVGGGWEAEGGLNIHWHREGAANKAQK